VEEAEASGSWVVAEASGGSESTAGVGAAVGCGVGGNGVGGAGVGCGVGCVLCVCCVSKLTTIPKRNVLFIEWFLLLELVGLVFYGKNSFNQFYYTKNV
jgi:hypothetical protein